MDKKNSIIKKNRNPNKNHHIPFTVTGCPTQKRKKKGSTSSDESLSPSDEIHHYISLEDDKQLTKKHRSASTLSRKTFVCDRISCSSTMAKTRPKSSHDTTKENKTDNVRLQTDNNKNDSFVCNKMTLSEWRQHQAQHMVQELAQIQYVLTRATKDGLTLTNEEHIKKCYNETKDLLGKNSNLIDPFDPMSVFEEKQYHQFLSNIEQSLINKITKMSVKKQELIDELIGKTMESSAFVLIQPLFLSKKP